MAKKLSPRAQSERRQSLGTWMAKNISKKTKENIVKQMYKELTCYYGLDDCSAAFDYLQLQSASSQRPTFAQRACFVDASLLSTRLRHFQCLLNARVLWTRVYCKRISFATVQSFVNTHFVDARLLSTRLFRFCSIFRQHAFCGHASLVNVSLLFLFYLSSTRVLWTRVSCQRVSFVTSSLSWCAPKTLQRSALVAQRHVYTLTYSRPPPRAFLESRLGAKVWRCPNRFITMSSVSSAGMALHHLKRIHSLCATTAPE
ncbi:uncharacterized protein F5891DRAFT_979777 [Suillus fuscotomentosus]|uniref:Uncharacterized protein n=1 Tax=Suillus fuscotomentosus TaxID=1912939 RepID=A0AAD4E7Z8_9AGAM|nr:uncharacterized protein F5891DRAFT_979777 [Suillus fuscotomentosus]KAG1901250.1 hypothetical protein F5891DRAFT_979777 [Suillus fuscotomentosus]